MFCARFGGDEFIAFGKEEKGSDTTLEERLNNMFDKINKENGKPYRIAASIGTIVAPATEDTAILDIIQQADDKMYNIKKERKAAR